MNTIQATFQQFAELFRGMTWAQRTTLVLVPLLIVSGFAMLLWGNRGPQMTALSWGKVYSTEELINAEQALIQAGLTDFRREGQRLMVPESEKDRYNAALLEYDAMPTDLGTQMLKQYESLSPFITEKQRSEMKDAMLLQELRRTLRAIPDLEDARVVVANPLRKNAWSAKGRVTATVSVRPKGGRELSSKLVNSLRAAVASMVPDLKPSDVTVFDMVHGTSHTGEPENDPFDNGLLKRIEELTAQYERKIRQDLDYIPQVGVTVHVDVENVKSSVSRSQQVDPKKVAPVMSNEITSNDTQTQRPPRGEPGQVANRPGSVGGGASVDRQRQSVESNTKTVNGLSFEVVEKELLAAMPKAVQVSVSIPRDYYRDIVARRTAAGEKEPARLDPAAIEKEVTEAVTRSVTRLIPLGSPAESIAVNSIDRLPVEVPAFNVPLTERLGQWFQQWGGTLGLAVLALWALWMLRKSTPKLPPAPVALERSFDGLAGIGGGGGGGEQSASTGPPKPVTKRDQIQTLVRENPEATAAVIGKWIQAAK